MNLRLLGAGSAALLLSSAASAAIGGPIVIDDFLTGSILSGTFEMNGTGTMTGQQSGSMVGGQRDVGLDVIANPFARTIGVDLTEAGFGLFLESGSGVSGSLLLDYDGSTDVETGSLPFEIGEGLNLDLSALTDLQIDFGFVSESFQMSILLQQFDDGGNVIDEGLVVTTVDGSDDPTAATVALSEFLIDVSDVDRIVIAINLEDGGDQTAALDLLLQGISVVPAPSAFALLGVFAVGRRRRRA